MHDAVAMREREAFGHLRDDVGDPMRRQHDSRVEDLAQRLAVEELHGDVRHVFALAHVVNGHDVGMVESPRGPGFAEEPSLERVGLRVRHADIHGFDRDQPIDKRVESLVDDTHRAACDLADDLVSAESLPGCQQRVGHLGQARVTMTRRGTS